LELITVTAGTPLRHALAKHDAAIVLSVLRGLSGRVVDGVTLLVVVPVLALFARAWLAALPDELRALAGFGASSLIATLLAKGLIERLWFHQADGVLARDAQRPSDAAAFLAPLIFAGIAMGLGALAVLGLADPGGMVMGVCSGLPAGALLPFVREHLRRWWRRFAPQNLRSLTQTRLPLAKAAGLSVAVGIASLSLPSEYYLDAIAVGVYGLGVILLTAGVDARVVRYMTLVGHNGASLLRHWLPIQLALLWPAAIVLLAAQAWVPASVTVLIAVALPVVTALRIFAYRAFSRLIADWAVGIVILGAVYVGLTLPPLGPAIIGAALVWLARHGAGSRWLLA
jgi:hypothetical protein